MKYLLSISFLIISITAVAQEDVKTQSLFGTSVSKPKTITNIKSFQKTNQVFVTKTKKEAFYMENKAQKNGLKPQEIKFIIPKAKATSKETKKGKVTFEITRGSCSPIR